VSYFLESWIREFGRDDNLSDGVVSRLIVALGVLDEYLERFNSGDEPNIDLEDYATSAAGRATAIYVLYSNSGDNRRVLHWPPWRNNAKINIDDVLLLAESGLVYVSNKLSDKKKLCSNDDIAKIVYARPGVEKDKIEECRKLILESLKKSKIANEI